MFSVRSIAVHDKEQKLILELNNLPETPFLILGPLHGADSERMLKNMLPYLEQEGDRVAKIAINIHRLESRFLSPDYPNTDNTHLSVTPTMRDRVTGKIDWGFAADIHGKGFDWHRAIPSRIKTGLRTMQFVDRPVDLKFTQTMNRLWKPGPPGP